MVGAPLGRVHAQGRRFYDYRLHMAVCAKTDLPLAWTVETASAQNALGRTIA
jgi:hypothetical protein